jgi:Ca2+/H+ antiporter, TMEM165/GDT1 family
MMCCGEKKGTGYWVKRAIFIPIAIAAGIFVFGWVVMQLWNCILPAVIGVSTITFWQALGILILSKILFGGFKGGHGHSKYHHGHDWHGKWMHLTPEEKEKMKSEWKDKCCTGEKQD